MGSTAPEPLIDVDELSRELSVKRGTLTWWARKGHIPSRKLGPRTRRYYLSEVRKALGLEREGGER